VTLTTILNFAVGMGYRAANPAASINRPILDDRPVGILDNQLENAPIPLPEFLLEGVLNFSCKNCLYNVFTFLH